MTKFDDDFTPSSSNPVLSIARHYDVDLDVAYGYADLVLRTYQTRPDERFTENVWHLYAIWEFSVNVEHHTLIQNMIQKHVLLHRGVEL